MPNAFRSGAARGFLLLTVILPMLPVALRAQKWLYTKPYEDWSWAEATQLLQESPWVKFCAAGKIVTTDDQHRNAEGDRTWGARTYSAFYVLRLLTARPVREAYLRQLSFLERGTSVDANRLAAESGWKAQFDRLQDYIRSNPNDALVQSNPQHIILSVSWSVGNEEPVFGARMRAQREVSLPDNLRQLQFSDLAPVSLLSVDSRKKARLLRFEVKGSMYARFYFPRMSENGNPLIADGDKKLRFESRLGKNRIVAEFQIPKLLWKGRCEY